MVSFTFALFCFVFLPTGFPVNAHSYMTYPEPYTRNNCKGGLCQACPDIRYRTRLSNSETSPEITWRRGQNITVVWARNNHGGGFVRLAFVPVSKRKDIDAHSSFAFYYGCWEQNIFPCSGSLCGSDKSRRAYRAFTTVPPVIPDGVYILAQVWYGGLKYTRLRGTFSNYASCAYVRIRGGLPLQPAFQPVYVPGVLGEFESSPPGECLTSAVKVGECLTGCDHVASFFALPFEFADGRSPPALTPALYGQPVPTPEQASDPKVLPDVASPDDGLDGGSTNNVGRICKHGYCCPIQCGSCGGKGCAHRPGGINSCCTSKIRASGRSCRRYDPPCML